MFEMKKTSRLAAEAVHQEHYELCPAHHFTASE
jgi:hypothetical protein